MPKEPFDASLFQNKSLNLTDILIGKQIKPPVDTKVK